MAAKKRMKGGSVVAQEKAKKQKILLAVLGVLLVGLLAFQGPKTLKALHKGAPAEAAQSTDEPAVAPATPAAATPSGSPTPAPVAATAGAPQATVVVAGGIGIADTPTEPVAGDGQLISFDRFRTKDPFVPQVSEGCSPDPVEGVACPSVETTPAAPAETQTEPTPTSTPTQPSSPTPTPTPTLAPTTVTPPSPPAETVPPSVPVKPTSATISVNGATETVALKASFPESEPTFTLAAVTKKAAKIGLVGGSYSDGDPTITLKLGKTVTLMNTADGTRYKLKLVSVS